MCRKVKNPKQGIILRDGHHRNAAVLRELSRKVDSLTLQWIDKVNADPKSERDLLLSD
jgi:hypothetical protein